jgi:hypothetical protein
MQFARLHDDEIVARAQEDVMRFATKKPPSGTYQRVQPDRRMCANPHYCNRYSATWGAERNDHPVPSARTTAWRALIGAGGTESLAPLLLQARQRPLKSRRQVRFTTSQLLDVVHDRVGDDPAALYRVLGHQKEGCRD